MNIEFNRQHLAEEAAAVAEVTTDSVIYD